jgi:hypothetical protein
MYEEPDGGAIEDLDEREALDALLSATPPEPRTVEVKVASLGGAKLVLRELTEQEFDDWQRRFVKLPRRGPQVAGTAHRERSLVEANAHLVAYALVSPTFTQEQLSQVGVTTVADLLRRKLKPMEILQLADVVMQLLGGAEDAVSVGKD